MIALGAAQTARKCVPLLFSAHLKASSTLSEHRISTEVYGCSVSYSLSLRVQRMMVVPLCKDKAKGVRRRSGETALLLGIVSA